MAHRATDAGRVSSPFQLNDEPKRAVLDDQVRFLVVGQEARMVEPRREEALGVSKDSSFVRRRHLLIIAILTHGSSRP